MDKIFENIIRQGRAIGKSYEEINAELKAAGADFHLSDLGDPGEAGEAVVSVPSGKYRITWDEDGHPVKAIRL